MRAHRSGYERSARFYDLFDHKENIPFFLDHARTAGEVLDVGAGTGRIAIPLAREGLSVTCIEPSPAMRAEFEQKLQQEPGLRERITIRAGSAADFACSTRFPLCILSGTFDHFLNDQERTASLQNIARHLGPRGRLIFDVFLVS